MSLLDGYFVPWFLFALWDFGECDGCVGLFFLACSADVFTGNPCWCWRLGYWSELEEERMGGEVLHDLWGMESERRGRPQQISCYRARNETWRMDLRRGMVVPLANLLLES